MIVLDTHIWLWLIIATAIVHDAFLMSLDRKFRAYDELSGKLL
jgi:hypothetical protein